MIFRFNLSITNILIGLLILFYFLQFYFGNNNLYFDNSIGKELPFFSLFGFLFHDNFWNLYIDCYFIFYIGNFLEKIYNTKKYLMIYLIVIFFSNIFFFILYFVLGESISYASITGYLGYGLIGYMIGNIILYDSLVYKQYLINIVLNLGIFILISILLGIEVFRINYILILISGLASSIFITNREFK